MTRTGTNYFKNLDAAIKYYEPQGENRENVLEKWKNLEIEIGEINKSNYILDKDGRYWLIEIDKK